MRAHVGAQLPCTATQLLSIATRPALQAATIQSIGCMGFLNVGVQLGLAGQSTAAGAALALSGVCAGFVLWGFRRVKVGGCVGAQVSGVCCPVNGKGGLHTCRDASRQPEIAVAAKRVCLPLRPCCSGWTSLRRASRRAPSTTPTPEQYRRSRRRTGNPGGAGSESASHAAPAKLCRLNSIKENHS